STTSRSGSRPNAPSPASTTGPPAPRHGIPIPQQNYEIRVRGRLGETFRTAFLSLRARTQGNDTVLSGSLVDRAALYGVLAIIETLGLELVELRQVASSELVSRMVRAGELEVSGEDQAPPPGPERTAGLAMRRSTVPECSIWHGSAQQQPAPRSRTVRACPERQGRTLQRRAPLRSRRSKASVTRHNSRG